MEYLLLPRFITIENSKLAENQDFSSIRKKMKDELDSYYKVNYKTVSASTFESSIDYLIQKLNLTIGTLESTVSINWENEALVIENLLFDFERFLKKKENDSIKRAMIQLKSLISKDRQQSSMINYIKKQDTKTDLDDILHNERLSKIIRAIIEVDTNDIPKSSELYRLVLKNNDRNQDFNFKKICAFQKKYIKEIDLKKTSHSSNQIITNFKEEIKIETISQKSPKVRIKNKKHNMSTNDSHLLLRTSVSNGDFNSTTASTGFFSRLKKPKPVFFHKGEKKIEAQDIFHEELFEMKVIGSEKSDRLGAEKNNIIVENNSNDKPDDNENYIIIKEDPEPEPIVEVKSYKYYIKTNPDDYIQFAEPYGTDDQDLQLFVELINEPVNSGSFDHVVKEKNLNVYRRDVEGRDIILIKAISILDFTKEVVFRAISDVKIRKDWDKVFNEFKIIETSAEREVLYMQIESPFPVDNREFVQQRKIWSNFPDPNTICIHFKSIDHKDVPYKKKIVRAETIISGYYIHTVSESPPKTMVISVSQTDIKGSIPKFIVNPLAAKSPKEWIQNLIKGCNMVLKSG